MSVIFRSVVRWFLPVIITGQVLAACANPDPAALAAGQDQQLLTEALTRIANEYVDPVDSRELAYSAIRSMVQNLDPHSSFLTPAEFRALQETTQGSFGGVGVEITWRDGALYVVKPLAGTPAGRAGIRAGDRILQIDGKPVPAGDIHQVIELLRGPPGTTVSLSLVRSDQRQPIQLTLVREQILAESVTTRFVAPDIGYLHISQFHSRTDDELREALALLKRPGKDLFSGLILDLRGNPGGLLDQAVKVADVFLERGVIVSTRGRDPESTLKFMAHQHGTEPGYPLVVLVNNGTASAAEIVAGALRDQGRAVLIGTRSYGKGSVQKLIGLVDGSGLRLTTALYYTPKGDSIQGHGIDPDLVISPLAGGSDPPVIAIEGQSRRALDSVSAAGTESVPLGNDAQLQHAVELLQNWPKGIKTE